MGYKIMANLTPVNSFDDVIQLETNTVALGGVGGPMNAQAQALLNRTYYLKTIVDNLIVDALNSTDDTKALSAKQGKALSDSLANKLDASAYVQHYRGKFVSLVALQTALPTANDGDYAIVDSGSGNDAQQYIWDAQDEWVSGGSVSGSTTDDITEGSTNLYFTSSRAITAGAAAFARYDQAQSLTDAQKSQFLTNVGAKRSCNLINKTASYTLQLSDFKNDVDLYDVVYLRMNSATANNITIDTTLSSLPNLSEINIRNVGTGLSTLVASGTTLNGNLVFTAQHEVKTIVKVDTNEWDVIGVLP